MRSVIWLQIATVICGVDKPFLSAFNVRGVSDVRQAELHTAEPPVPEPSALEIELDIKKLKSHKTLGIGQIPTELWQRVKQFTLGSISLLFLFGVIRNCLRSGSSRSLYLCIRSTIKQIAVIKVAYFTKNVQNIIQSPAVKVNSIYNGNYTGQQNLIFFFLSYELALVNLAVLFLLNSDMHTEFSYHAGFK